MEYLNLLVDTKKEFSCILISYLYPEITRGINSIYFHCKKISNENNKDVLVMFQQMLLEIPKWNKSIINKETNRIKSNMNYIDDLLTAVFISNTRLLCSIKSSQKKIKLKIPKLEIFIHKCYIQCARDFYETLYLFDENNNKLTIQKNKKQIEYLIKNSIETVIRNFLPIKTILTDYLETNLSEHETDINQELVNIINNEKESNKEDTHKNESDNKKLSDEKEIQENNNYEKQNDDLPKINIDNIIIESNDINPIEDIIDSPNILFDKTKLKEKLIKLNTN